MDKLVKIYVETSNFSYGITIMETLKKEGWIIYKSIKKKKGFIIKYYRFVQVSNFKG